MFLKAQRGCTLDNDKRANDYQVGGDHYLAKFQHWDLAAENRLGYFEGQVTKYLTRWRRKNGTQDLDKAMHYLQKLIEAIQDGTLSLPLSRTPLMLETFSVQNGLTLEEKGIFRIMLTYDRLAELDIAMEWIKGLKEKTQ